jgi:hypothetical protein
MENIGSSGNLTPVENLGIQAFFQSTNFCADACLGQADIISSLGKASGFGNFLKTTQHVYVQINGYHVSHNSLLWIA